MFGEKLASYYRNLASLLEAGVPPVRAFDSLSKAFGGKFRHYSLVMKNVIDQGGSMEDAMLMAPRLIDPLHVKLVAAGAQSGKVHEVLVSLAEGLEANAKALKGLITRLLYPALIFHLAIGIVALVITFFAVQGNRPWWSGLAFAFGILGPVYGMGLAGWFVWRIRRKLPLLELLIDGFLYYTPLFGGVTRNLALARFCRTLENLYNAGIHMAESIDVAATACGNRILRGRLLLAIPVLKEGNGLEVALPATGAFNSVVTSMLVTGAETGKMHVMLHKVAEQAQFDAEQSIARLGVIIPLVLYLMIMGFIVVMIFSVLAVYVNMLNSLL